MPFWRLKISDSRWVVNLHLCPSTIWMRQHGHRRVFALGMAGLALITLAAVLEATHWVSHTWAAVVTSAGGVLLIVAHWRNLKPRVCSNLSSRSMR